MDGKKRFIIALVCLVAIAVIAAITVPCLQGCSATEARLLPAPSQAQDNSIPKQVAETIVYKDQEQAKGIASVLDDLRDELALDAVAARADIAKEHRASHDAGALQEAVEKPCTLASMEGEMQSSTLSINGDIVPYVDSYETASAPVHGAGLWMGDDSTTDGSWGYFIGHNPGDFTSVMTLATGDEVDVCDSEGNERSYSVIDTFDVPDDTYWEDIQSKVSGYGESVVLQTCCGDNEHYRVVVAK